MTTPARTPGKRGKLPARHLDMAFLHDYVKTPLPAPAYPVDVRAGIADDAWGMDANGPDPTCTTHPDGVGDCGFAGRQHARMAKAAFYGEAETWETSDELVDEYLAYDGGQDNGVVLADVLLAWYRSGKIKAFAPVDHTSPAAVDSAMEAFRGVYCGVDLTGDADELFRQGQPWTVADGEQPDTSAGHCIVKVYADVVPDPHAGDGYVTWGAFQKATDAWTQACLTEAFVIITTEDEAAKVDMTSLLADIEALGGTGGATAPKGGTGVFAVLKDILERIDGKAEAELQEAAADARKALADIEAQVAQAEPLLTAFEAAVKAAIEADAPTLKADIAALVAKLLADFAPMLGKAPAGM